jgi:hypothetical protein
MNPHHHATFLFHGLTLSFTSDNAALLEAITSRFSAFSGSATSSPDLTFEFCTSTSHTLGPPTGEGRPIYNTPHGDVLYFAESDTLYLTHQDDIRVKCDLKTSRVQVSVLESSSDKVWLLSHPIVTLPLLELLKRKGFYSVHAAGLCQGEGSLLLVGSSGAGKSTLTVALLQAGYGFQGDDMLFLDSVLLGSTNGLRVNAFPDELDLTDNTLAMLKPLRDLKLSKRPGAPKYSLQAKDHLGAKVVPRSTPKVLVFPRVVAQPDSQLLAMRGDEALLELLPNVLLTEARSSQAHLNALTQLAKTCRCFRLHTGQNLESAVALLAPLLNV